MNECLNPPCSSSVATSCVEPTMASSSDEGRVTAPFFEGVSISAEGELAIDENASTVSLVPNPCVVPDLSLAVQEGQEQVRNLSDHLSREKSASSRQILGCEVVDADSFVNIMNGIASVGDAESGGWTFQVALARASLSVEISVEGVVDTSHLPTC